MEKEKLDREKMATMAQRSGNQGGGMAQFREVPTRARSQCLEGLENSEGCGDSEDNRDSGGNGDSESDEELESAPAGLFSPNPSLSSTNHCHTRILNVQLVRSKFSLNCPAWNRCLSTADVFLLTLSITA